MIGILDLQLFASVNLSESARGVFNLFDTDCVAQFATYAEASVDDVVSMIVTGLMANE